MNAIPIANLGLDLGVIRASEIERQKWFNDPRDLQTSDPRHQWPILDGVEMAWEHTNYRYEWQCNGMPAARPLTGGNLVFNEQNQWWERNGVLWQADKKSKGGRQMTTRLRHLGVVLQPRTSRLFGKVKTFLRLNIPLQESTRLPKDDPRGVPIVVSEVPIQEIAAQTNFDLTASRHIVYTPKMPFSIVRCFKRKTCRHPSTCTLHTHINVDFPQSINVPVVDEPEKLEATQSGFLLRPCQYKGHEHLPHEQDPCFSHTKENDAVINKHEETLKQMLRLPATDEEAAKLERIWRREEEQEREQEILMSLPSIYQKENRPPSVSAQTLFHNAAKSLQRSTTPGVLGGHGSALSKRTADTVKIRGGSGRTTAPLSWKMRKWFTGISREVIKFRHIASDEGHSNRDARSNKVRHSILSAREAGRTSFSELLRQS